VFQRREPGNGLFDFNGVHGKSIYEPMMSGKSAGVYGEFVDAALITLGHLYD